MTATQKILLLTVIALALGFSSVMATETRVGSMGGVGFYTHDNSNIFFFPGSIYSYAGQVVGEFRFRGDDNRYTVGVNYPIGEYSVVGAYLNRPIFISIPDQQIRNHVTLNQTTDIFYGMQMSQYDLGLKLSVALDGSKKSFLVLPDTLREVKGTASYVALAAGLSNERMDVGLQFELPSAKVDSLTLSNKWSGFGFGLKARMFSGDKTKLVPLGVFDYRKTKLELKPTTNKNDYTDFNVGLGLGVNHQINENNLLVMAVEVLGLSSTKVSLSGRPTGQNNDTTTTITTLPGLFMGLESKIKPWLTGRVGAVQVFQSQTLKVKPEGGTETKTTTRSSQYKVTFGLGFNFSDFVIDASFNENLLFDGPNFVSGGVDQMFHRLSVTYKF